jgi:hypothetical protein
MSDYKSLQDAIKKKHECDSVHTGSTMVTERLHGNVVWDGAVETFTLIGHAKAKECYAWSYRDGDETKFVSVFVIPPVFSASDAVHFFTASESQFRIPFDLGTLTKVTPADAHVFGIL